MIAEQTNIKSGYKKTIVGFIPNDWNVSKIIDVANYVDFRGKTPSKTEQGIFLVTAKNIKNGYIDYESSKEYIAFDDYKNVMSRGLPVKGDVLITTEAPLGSVAQIDNENIALAQRIIKYRAKKDLLVNDFLKYYFLSPYFQRLLEEKSTGSTAKGIKGSTLHKLSIILPPLPEQQKIASILSTWDEAITATKSLIVQTKKRNKGLAQQLLSGKTRLKGFEGKWKFEKISSVTDRIKNSFIPEKETFYKQIGIRSHGKGLFYKDSVSGESLGNKSVFWLEPNCFIVNIVFAWEQAVAKTTENEKGMIASHRFPMFKPKNDILDLDFILYFFKSPKGKDLLTLASPGGAGRNKTLGQSDFSKLKIPVPEIKEQQAISKVLENANQELKTLEQKLNVLQEQKKGLMQKLLTGEIRVKIN